jgi:phosphoribosylaminoimidazolecarboxamide formyltransferase/IMP cyclohydrolase
MAMRKVDGGLLFQEEDQGRPDQMELKVVTKKSPSDEERRDLLFAMKVAKHVRSNAIVLAKGRTTIGIGAGQMSRLDSVRIATEKAGDRARGACLASDAFFPFKDGVLEASRAGILAIIQPGGSVRDKEVIEAADECGISMVFTGMRHFRH